MVCNLTIFHMRYSNSTCRHQFPVGNNFGLILLEIGLQTGVCMCV